MAARDEVWTTRFTDGDLIQALSTLRVPWIDGSITSLYKRVTHKCHMVSDGETLHLLIKRIVK